MNLLELIFFSVFVLFSKWKGEAELTGFNALLVFGLTLFFNALTIVMISIALGYDFEFIDYMDSKFKWLLFTVFWFLALSILIVRKNQIIMYREKIKELTEKEIRKTKSIALIYCIASVIIGVVTAYSANYIVNR